MLRIVKPAVIRSLPVRSYSSACKSASIASSQEIVKSNYQKIITEDISKANPIPVFKHAMLHNKAAALKDVNGEFSYFDLVVGSQRLSSKISDLCGSASNSRIAYLTPNDVTSVISQWSCWMSGQIAVPLCSAHPPELLEYFIKDSQTNLIITTPEFEAKIKPIAEKLDTQLLTVEHKQFIDEQTKDVEEESISSTFLNGDFYKSAPAMIVYTSGTTAKPKGVVFSHSNLEAQVSCLNSAWNITKSDTLLHSLPLHHVHGLINAMLTSFTSGGKVIMLPKFETERVWTYLLNINMPQKDRVTLYMGVPTIYNYLIQEYDKLFKKDSQMTDYIRQHCSNKIRLMVSGSAPLPAPVFQRWREITGHKLLERYGMTEIGMALSNTLKEDDIKQRLPGFVGLPLPNVQVRIVKEDSQEVLLEAHGEFNKGLWSDEAAKIDTVKIPSKVLNDSEIVGNLEVKGPTVFKEYWNKPEATKKEFTDDGWFRTGDAVSFDPTFNSFKVLGRNSCDIIKSRGYKISALEMETKLLEHPLIEDCAVIGIPDEVYGQKIVALVKCRAAQEVESPEQKAEVSKTLNKWCQSKFASYSLPSIIEIISVLPRNQMGKVNKADLVADFMSQQKEAQATSK